MTITEASTLSLQKMRSEGPALNKGWIYNMSRGYWYWLVQYFQPETPDFGPLVQYVELANALGALGRRCFPRVDADAILAAKQIE